MYSSNKTEINIVLKYLVYQTHILSCLWEHHIKRLAPGCVRGWWTMDIHGPEMRSGASVFSSVTIRLGSRRHVSRVTSAGHLPGYPARPGPITAPRTLMMPPSQCCLWPFPEYSIYGKFFRFLHSHPLTITGTHDRDKA